MGERTQGCPMREIFARLKVELGERADSLEEYSDMLEDLRLLVYRELKENNRGLLDRHENPTMRADRVSYTITEYAPYRVPHGGSWVFRTKLSAPGQDHLYSEWVWDDRIGMTEHAQIVEMEREKALASLIQADSVAVPVFRNILTASRLDQ